MRAVPRAGMTFIALVCLANLVYLVAEGATVVGDQRWLDLALIAVLSIVANAWKGDVNSTFAISVGFIVTLASTPLLGVWGAVLVATISAGVHAREVPWFVTGFNSGLYGLSCLAGGLVYGAFGGSFTLTTVGSQQYLMDVVLPLIAAAMTQFAAQVLLLGVVQWLFDGVPMGRSTVAEFATGALPYVGYGLFGLLLAVLWDGAGIGPFAAVLVLAPLYIARWAWAQNEDYQRANERTVAALVRAVEAKDLYTRGHSERVAKASVMIAGPIGLTPQRTRMLGFAGTLHDVGKIAVPTTTLQKSGRLTDTEFEQIALHPVHGFEIVRDIEVLSEAYQGILHHHERLDGRGYPMGLRGDDIPEFARIIAVADAFDAMTSTRSYRDARPVDDAVAELRRCAGSQFEARFVEALVEALAGDPWVTADRPDGDAAAALAAAHFDHDDPAAPPPPPRTRPVPGRAR